MTSLECCLPVPVHDRKNTHYYILHWEYNYLGEQHKSDGPDVL